MIGKASQHLRRARFGFELVAQVQSLPGTDCGLVKSGAPGGVSSLFLRGGNANLNLVEIDGVPVIGFVESAGARMQEGLAALSGYARIFRKHVALSGHVPQISVICGPSAGGGSYAPALTDFVIMTESASMFLTGPGVVAKVTGEDVDQATLGGPRIH